MHGKMSVKGFHDMKTETSFDGVERHIPNYLLVCACADSRTYLFLAFFAQYHPSVVSILWCDSETRLVFPGELSGY